MSDDFQRGLQARLAHLIGEASQWSRGSGAHPPGLVKALNEAFEYGCAEIERLQRERDALAAKVASYERIFNEGARYRYTEINCIGGGKESIVRECYSPEAALTKGDVQ